jgi:methyl-accepting chemotaxis protein
MSEDSFRIVVTVAVGLVCLAGLLVAGVAVAFFGTVRRLQRKVDELADVIEPVVGKIGPVVDRIGPVIDRIGPALDSAAPLMEQIPAMIEKAGLAIDQIGLASEKVGSVSDKIGSAVESARGIMDTAGQIIQDSRPRVAAVSSDVAGIARSGREQMELIGEVLQDITGRAHDRIEQIDQTVDNTVDQIGHLGDAVKRAAMRPVREVNGLAAGISAAISSLAKGRKSSVDSATQDEELFI